MTSQASSAGKKRAAEDPPSDCGDDDSVNKKGEMEQQEDVSMECLSFQEYCDTGGLWIIACREPKEDVEDSESSGASEQDSFEEQFWDNRTGKPLDAEKVRAARAEELRELDRRVWEEADLQECFDKKGRGPICIPLVDVDKGFGVHRSRLVAKDFKPRSKIDDKEGLFAATPPLEWGQGTDHESGKSEEVLRREHQKDHVLGHQQSSFVCSHA